ncbi:MAG TPA: PAS domain-containing sensor histidine kinase [Myxococcota bacterium]
MTGAAPASPAEDHLDPRLEQLAAAVPHGVLLLRDGCVVWANERLIELAGRRADLRGVALSELLEDAGAGLPRPGAERVLECALRRPSGDRRAVLCRCAWDEAGSQPGVWVIEDLTRVRALESEVLHAGQESSKLNRELESLRERLRGERGEREELLAVVSHELRTPLTIISGYSRLLLSEEVGPLNEDQRRFLDESRKGCERLDRFIRNLLDASRASKGNAVLEVCTESLEPVIAGVAEMFRPMLEEHQVRLVLDIAPEASRVRFDRARVEQILTNLVGNAIRYAPVGGRIDVCVRPLDPPNGASEQRYVEVSVADDGPGIPVQDRERIFRPYVQAGEDQRAGGLGLGLAICKRLVKAHGGRIGVTEREGGGSRFFFTLPAPPPLASYDARKGA